MNRSNYSDDLDTWDLIRWRGAVKSAIRGRRGQSLIRELLEALESLPDKRLCANEFANDGDYCALGALGRLRGMDLRSLDPGDTTSISAAFGIADALAREIMYENDYSVSDHEFENVVICGPVRPWESHRIWNRRSVPGAAERRWMYMHHWAKTNLQMEES